VPREQHGDDTFDVTVCGTRRLYDIHTQNSLYTEIFPNLILILNYLMSKSFLINYLQARYYMIRNSVRTRRPTCPNG